MRKLLDGLLLGLGLGIAALVTALVFAFVVPWDKAAAKQTAAMTDAAMQSSFSGGKVVILEHEKVVRGDDVIVLGKLKNEGPQTARSFAIQVELYDTKGRFVDMFRESYYGTLKVGEERHFRVASGSCRRHPFAEHATYKVVVLEG
jgi:hypothetical protein